MEHAFLPHRSPYYQQYFPPNIRGKVIGFNTASIYAGLTLGPYLGKLFVDYLGWKWLFLFTALISTTGFIFSRTIFRCK